MTRSGIETILRAVLYSGFFSKREECSRVETSSGREKIRDWEGDKEGMEFRVMHTFICLLEFGLRWEVRHDYDDAAGISEIDKVL